MPSPGRVACPGLLSLFGALAAFTAAACSGGSGTPEEEFCAQYAELECRTLAGWCGFTAEACQSARLAACQIRVLGLRSAARHYDGRAAIACLGKLGEVYRSQPIGVANLRALDEACDRVYHGNHGRGEACSRSNDCQRGLVCNRQLCVADQVRDEGSPCDRAEDICAPSQFCSSQGGAASGRVCLPRSTLGQPCTTEPCQPNLRCNGMACVERLAQGAECEADQSCALPHAFCNPYTAVCADRVEFKAGSIACDVQAGRGIVSDAGRPDGRRPSDAAAESPDAATESSDAAPE